MQWFAQAPSNIALIKYMGKQNKNGNIPTNASLSYTLNNLLSSVVLETQPGKKDFWEPLSIPGAMDFNLSTAAQERYLNHLQMLKSYFNYNGAFIVRSCNNFPHSSGLASSASSFAALTKCAMLALSEQTGKPMPSVEEQAKLSRMGSGSSCRSFFSPWAIWKDEHAQAIELPYRNLIHKVIVISHEEKAVSSREAHMRVLESKLYEGRPQRAEHHLKLLIDALEAEDWQSAYQICWREFQDMHQLFETAKVPFSYRTKETRDLLDVLQNHWQRHNDGPIVTMDAGPNIHLLYRPDQTQLARDFHKDYLLGNFDVL